MYMFKLLALRSLNFARIQNFLSANNCHLVRLICTVITETKQIIILNIIILECNHSRNQKFLTSYCSDNTFNIDFVNLNLIEAQFLTTYIHFRIAITTFAIYVK